MKLFIPLLLFAFAELVPADEFPTVMAERNLEKRSELALQEADRVIGAAKQAYEENQLQAFQSRLNDVTELVDLSYKSLVDTGKRARKSPKYWKKAEQAMRALTRRLDSVAAEVSLQDRDAVTAARKHVSDVHDQVVHDVMTKK